jgi:hypothetical protein
LHINARSLVNKINQMRIICNKSIPDLLCINESWFNSGHEDIELRITYDLYRKDRMFANGGGVCLSRNRIVLRLMSLKAILI